MQQSLMVELKASCSPAISFRPIKHSDREHLEQIHADIFPIRYEAEFFQNVVNGHDIVSWGAVDRNGDFDRVIGFVTAKIILARDSEIRDILRSDFTNSDEPLVYILTLGVVESYRNFGIATSLIREVLKYASSIVACRAVFLHVISYNNAAIHLYKKLSFKCVRRLHDFYVINDNHYDSYVFVYYVNGGRSPCSLLEAMRLAISGACGGFMYLRTIMCRKEEERPKRYRENKRLLTDECCGDEFA